MRRARQTFRLAFLALCIGAAAGRGATSVALVGTAESELVAQVHDLATVALSETDGFTVLERTTITQVLAEQRLSAAALVSPAQALAVGKLLGADILAVLEGDAPTPPLPGLEPPPPVLGLVVYDPGSGLRLWDDVLAQTDPELAADAVTAAVKAATAKRGAPTSAARSLSLLAVRNADLPREMDSVCDAVASLFERQLLRCRGVSVLERERLRYAAQERELPTERVAGELRKSLIILEIEFCRGPAADTLRGTVCLTAATGATLGKLSADAPAADPAVLADLLAEKLARKLNTATPGAAKNRTLEARRFAQAAQLYRAHVQYARAARAAEASYALDPTPASREALSRLLLSEAADALAAERGAAAAENAIRHSVGLARRALQLRTELLQQAQQSAPHMIAHYRSRPDPTFSNQLGTVVALLNSLGAEHEPLHAETAELRRLAIGHIHAALDALRRVAEHAPGAFIGYTTQARLDLLQVRRMASGASGFADAVSAVMPGWLAMLAAADPNDAVGKGNACLSVSKLLSLCLDPQMVVARSSVGLSGWDHGTYYARTDPLFGRMRRAPHPVVRLCGSIQPVLSERAPTDREPDDRKARADAIVEALRSALGGPGRWPSRATALQAYYLAVPAIDALYRPAPTRKGEALIPVWRLMTERGELCSLVVSRALPLLRPTDDPDGALELVDRTLALCEDKRRHLFVGGLVRLRTQLQAKRAELEAAPASRGGHGTGAGNWYRAEPLLLATEHRGIDTLRKPLVAGGHVYAVALQDHKTLRPLRVPLRGGAPEWLGGAVPLVVKKREPPLRAVSNRLWCVSALCLGEDGLYVGTLEQGVLLFPLGGGPVRRIDAAAGLPSNYVRALAHLDGRLYAGLGHLRGAYLVAWDAKSGVVTVLASSQRKEKRTPLDGAGRSWVSYMTADPARQRVLLGTRGGLWAVGTVTNEIQHLLKCPAPDWGSPVRGDHVLLETHRTTIAYDVAKGRAQLIRGGASGTAGGRAEGPAPIRDLSLHFGPQAVVGDWLWVPRPLSRIAMSSGDVQPVPALAPGGKRPIDPATIIEPVSGGKQVVVGDWHALWLLTLDR